MANNDRKGDRGAKKGQKASGGSAEKKGGEAAAEKEAAVEKKAAKEPETAKGAAAEKEAVKEAAVEKKVEAQIAAAKAHPPDDEYPHAKGDPHKVNRREYFVIFGVLTLLTVLEIGVAKLEISPTLRGTALIGLAVTKAAFVGLYYMHLKHETRILKLTVALPMAMPAVYALVLIADSAWRLTRW
jgi:cytochrome c oxidase subunit IV